MLRTFIVLAVSVLLVIGCRDSDSTTGSGYSKPSSKIKIDGCVDDWADIAPLWAEAGAPGRGKFERSIDLKQVYLTNDTDYLYVFICCSPTVRKRYDANPVSGNLGYMYFDTDNDSATGCKGVDGFDYGKIDGYEVRAWLPLGVFLGTGGSGPFALCELRGVGADGSFSKGKQLYDHKSNDPDALIAHGKDGVEFAVPLEVLGVKLGRTVRVLLHEDAHVFEKAGFSEGVVTLKP